MSNLNMLPSLSVDDMVNHRCADMVSFCERAYSQLFRVVGCSYFKHFFIGKRSEIMAFASRHRFGMYPRTMPIPTDHTSLLSSVLHVIDVVTREKMRQANAPFHVAVVTNKYAIRKGTKGSFIGKTMRGNDLTMRRAKNSVPTIRYSASPKPASGGIGFINLTPKTFKSIAIYAIDVAPNEAARLPLYITTLGNIFSDKVGLLPAPTFTFTRGNKPKRKLYNIHGGILPNRVSSIRGLLVTVPRFSVPNYTINERRGLTI